MTAPSTKLTSASSSSDLFSSIRKPNSQKISSSSSNIHSNVHNYALKTGTASSAQATVPASNVQSKTKIDPSIIIAYKDKVYEWILDQSKQFKQKYFEKPIESEKIDKTDSKKSNPKKDSRLSKTNDDLSVLEKIKASALELEIFKISNESDTKTNDRYMKSLKKINNILHETDISSFEMIHSGLIEKLLAFLSFSDDMNNSQRKFCPINFSLPPSTKINPSYLIDINNLICNEFIALKLKQFLNVFLNLPLSFYNEENIIKNDLPTKTNFTCKYFSLLVSKLQNCVNQLEQYAVRVHDVPNSIGSGKAAIKFFNTHQIKCLLQRYPSVDTTTSITTTGPSIMTSSSSSSSLRQSKLGNVKVDKFLKYY